MKPVQNGGWNRNIKRKCPVCRQTYFAAQECLNRGRHTTCSRRCSYTFRGRQKQTSVDVFCRVCRRKVTRQPSHIKTKHGSNFCSRTCHYVGRRLQFTRRIVTKPYQYTKGGKTKLSKTAARVYASGKTLAFPKTELAVAAALTSLDIRFIHQHVVDVDHGAYVVDFFFPDRAIVIELDSTDGHREIRQNDAKRDRILRRMGLRVLRVRDNHVPDHAVRAVLSALFEGAKR